MIFNNVIVIIVAPAKLKGGSTYNILFSIGVSNRHFEYNVRSTWVSGFCNAKITSTPDHVDRVWECGTPTSQGVSFMCEHSFFGPYSVGKFWMGLALPVVRHLVVH
jgi:hypothetical protein